jgi:hypothetical protein
LSALTRDRLPLLDLPLGTFEEPDPLGFLLLPTTLTALPADWRCPVAAGLTVVVRTVSRVSTSGFTAAEDEDPDCAFLRVSLIF